METTVDRYDLASGARKRFEPDLVSLRDDGIWAGLRIEQWKGESTDLPESVLLHHGLVLNTGSSIYSDVHWSGHSRVSGAFANGQVVFYPSGMPYRVSARGFFQGYIVGIDPKFFRASVASIEKAPKELLPDYAKEDGFLKEAVNALARDVVDGHPYGALFGDSLSVALIAHLLSKYGNGKFYPDDGVFASRMKRERIQQFLLDRLQDHIPLSTMATIVEMDDYSFSRWFKAAFGVPPHQYLLRARIAKAKELLKSDKLSMFDISLQCGFYSQSHFSTSFRKMVGFSPAHYKKHVSL